MDHSNPPAVLAVASAAPAERSVAMKDQLFRYAEDLSQLIGAQGELEAETRALRESRDRLAESQDRLERLLTACGDIHLITDRDGRIVQANRAADAIAPIATLVGTPIEQWVARGTRDALRRLLEGGGAEAELRVARSAAGADPMIVVAHALPTAAARDPGVHWILRDVTPVREAQFANQVAALAFDNAMEAIVVTDLAGSVLSANPAYGRITGHPPASVTGRLLPMLDPAFQGEETMAAFWDKLRAEGTWRGELRDRRRTGELYPVWLTVSAAEDQAGQVLSYIVVFTDHTAMRAAERRLRHLAHHDSLTGLPNRLLAHDRLGQALAAGRRTGEPVTLAFLDLDGFKAVNDTLGHAAGDEVLREVSRRLRAIVRESDTVARVGGDEFVIVAPGLAGADSTARYCAKLQGALATPFAVDRQAIHLGASIGCAQSPRDALDADTLFEFADAAMYRAKRFGGSTAECHDGPPSPLGPERQLAAELVVGLENGEMRLEYQPQVQASDGAVVGVEALLRWDSASLGAVPPSRFIPVAERTGATVALGAWTLERACRQVASWDLQGMPPLVVAVNVGARQLRSPGFIESVRRALAVSGIEPSRLELDVRESDLLADLDTCRVRLQQLRELGVRTALDDFGSLYASLKLLASLPLDRLKVDRALVEGLGNEDSVRSEALLGALASLGGILGGQLVGKGVELEGQRRSLVRHGVAVLQGHLVGPAMRPERFAEWLWDRTECAP